MDLSAGPDSACHSKLPLAGEREGAGGDVERAAWQMSLWNTGLPVTRGWECYSCRKTRGTSEGFGGSGLKDCGDDLNR